VKRIQHSALLALGIVVGLLSAPRPARAEPRAQERWFAEFGGRLGTRHSDAYTARLDTFSFEEPVEGNVSAALTARAGYALLRYLAITVHYTGLEAAAYERDFSNDHAQHERFSFRSHALGAGVRARLPLVNEWMALYLSASLGAATVRTQFRGPDAEGLMDTSRTRSWGPWVDVGFGFQGHFTRYFGSFVELGYGYTNALENLLGDTHNLAGGYLVCGLRLRNLERSR
jgi:hypothetical protein